MSPSPFYSLYLPWSFHLKTNLIVTFAACVWTCLSILFKHPVHRLTASLRTQRNKLLSPRVVVNHPHYDHNFSFIDTWNDWCYSLSPILSTHQNITTWRLMLRCCTMPSFSTTIQIHVIHMYSAEGCLHSSPKTFRMPWGEAAAWTRCWYWFWCFGSSWNYSAEMDLSNRKRLLLHNHVYCSSELLHCTIPPKSHRPEFRCLFMVQV